MKRWAAGLALLALVGCQPAHSETSTATTPAAATTATEATTSSPAPATSAPATVALDQLAGLAIDDHPDVHPYRRDEWPHWLDIDHDGCDAREQALRAASTIPATIGARCRILAGHWVSAYDGKETSDPSAFDVDHVVPLAEANRSGGWAWSTDQRSRYANDQAVLWVVSASSNRSKGDQGPADWRPPLQSAWCDYAHRWARIKRTYHLTETARGRDALGQMMERCPS